MSAGPLNQQPQGLLDFFQVKTGGRVFPEMASEVLAPTWDLRDHYLSTNAEYSPPTALTWATATNTLIPAVAAVNWWRWVVSFNLAFVPANALDQLLGQFLLVSSTGAGELPFPIQRVAPAGAVSYPASFNFAASAGLQRWQHNVGGFWIPPGYSLQVMEVIGTNTAGGAQLNRSYRIANLRQ